MKRLFSTLHTISFQSHTGIYMSHGVRACMHKHASRRISLYRRALREHNTYAHDFTASVHRTWGITRHPHCRISLMTRVASTIMAVSNPGWHSRENLRAIRSTFKMINKSTDEGGRVMTLNRALMTVCKGSDCVAHIFNVWQTYCDM